MNRRLATALANSFFLRKGKELHEKHVTDYVMGGSFLHKLQANVYLILKDYGTGKFPPKLVSRESTFEGEREQFSAMEGSMEDLLQEVMQKPFRTAHTEYYLQVFCHIIDQLERRGIRAGSRILELGCGSGWLAELLAIHGYEVVGTTIAPVDIVNGQRRIDALKVKGLKCKLEFFAAPMEEVFKQVAPNSFDAVFCFEALHHAFDWRESLDSATRCLKPGGWLLLCSEPPPLHTYVCYRSSIILKTHEIGFKPNEIRQHLKKLNYDQIQIARPVFGKGLATLFMRLAPFGIKHGSILCRSLWVTSRKIK
ncbi:MAG: hypothetical protein JWM68_1728 [Verrucomicrobiales bacterium]|nr:hypothetical protein [Verrucomicrobiales bacterium]